MKIRHLEASPFIGATLHELIEIIGPQHESNYFTLYKDDSDCCDCGYEDAAIQLGHSPTESAEWHSWIAEHSHEDHCNIVRPNFFYPDKNIKVWWYEPGMRHVTVNRHVTLRDWLNILADCLDSLLLPADKIEV